MKGFTLLEVVISIIILAAVTTAILPGYNKFAAGVYLRSGAQEIALAIREAQASAFAVRGFDHDNNSATPLLFTAWGITVDKNISDNGFQMFIDSNGNKQFDNSANETVRFIYFGRKVFLKSICRNVKSAPPGECNLWRSDIIYQRPNPDTTLRAKTLAEPSLLPASGTYSDVEIIVENTYGKTSTIVIWSSGQISVE